MWVWPIHIALALGLIAVAAGAALLLWSRSSHERGSVLFKIIGHFVVVMALLNFFCIGYCVVRDWREGRFDQLYCDVKHDGVQCHGVENKNEMVSGSAIPVPHPQKSVPFKSIPSFVPPQNCIDNRCTVNQAPVIPVSNSHQDLIKA